LGSEREGEVGLFKSIRDLGKLTKEAKQLQAQQQAEAGYKPGFAGQMQQMGDMIGQTTEHVSGGDDNIADLERLA